MRKIVFILFMVPFISCNSIQEVNDDELIILTDILNDFISKEKIKNRYSEQPKYILLSDTLGAISTLKEKIPTLFKDKYDIEEYNLIFDEIIQSTNQTKNQFLDLNKINLENNFEFLKSSKINSSYNKYKFSSIAFDKEHENGVIVLEESIIQNGEIVQGYKAALLIRKQINGKWTYISKVNQNIRLMDEAHFSEEYFPWKESINKLVKDGIIEHIENEKNLEMQPKHINTESLDLRSYSKFGENLYILVFNTPNIPQAISVTVNINTETIREINIYTPIETRHNKAYN